MRNIRPELSDRLKVVTDERKRLQTRLDELATLEQAIALLLREEDLRDRVTQLSLMPVKTTNGHKVIGRTPLSRFIVKALADGQPRSLDEIVSKARADNTAFDGKSPKRVIRFALIGLEHNDYAKQTAPNVWQLTEKAIQGQQTQESRGAQVPEPKQETATVAGQ